MLECFEISSKHQVCSSTHKIMYNCHNLVSNSSYTSRKNNTHNSKAKVNMEKIACQLFCWKLHSVRININFEITIWGCQYFWVLHHKKSRPIASQLCSSQPSVQLLFHEASNHAKTWRECTLPSDRVDERYIISPLGGIWLDGLPGTLYAPIVRMLAKVSHTPWSHFRWPSSWAKTA
jgi:hypothetical protein